MEPPPLKKSASTGLTTLTRWAGYALPFIVLLEKITTYTGGFTFDRFPNIIVSLLFLPAVMLFAFGLFITLFNICFFKQSVRSLIPIGLVFISTIGIAALPFPGMTDGMRHRMHLSYTEAELLRFAADARSTKATLQRQKKPSTPSSLSKKMRSAYPELPSMGLTMSPVIGVRQDCVELIWGSWCTHTWGIRINDLSDENFPDDPYRLPKPEAQQIYPRIFVYYDRL